jgi:Mrp family chromosome partitioning ATPase/uncharacterized protein involved in exopolysaccharide biosynthesis
MEITDTSLIGAVRRYWYVVAGAGVVALVVGGAYALATPGPELFAANATVVVQDPATAVTGTPTTARFVATQAELLRSDIVAQEAVSVLAEGSPVIEVEAFDLIAATTVTFSGESGILSVAFNDPDPDLAVEKLNALINSYNQVSRLQVTSFSENALARIDAQLDAFDERQEQISNELRTAREENVGLATLERQFNEAITRIGLLQDERAATTSPTRLEEIRVEIDDLRQQMAVYREAIDAQDPSSTLLALAEEQNLIIDRRAELLTQRDQISIEAELAPGAVVSLLPAVAATALPSLGGGRIIAVALILGLALGTAAAYLLATRLRAFRNRTEPGIILKAPLLADIPDFGQENVSSALPVRDEPRSAAAEAFRFAAASLDMQMRSRSAKVVMVVSSTLGHGKSTCLINTALASAHQGSSVLIVDCDFGNQDSSILLRGETPGPPPGFTDVVEAGRPLRESIQQIALGNGVLLNLLSRGRLPSVASDTLRSAGARSLFKAVGESYDLIFVDAPPLLQVAYSSTLAGYCDALLVVVAHGTSARELEELTSRLELIGTPVAGYLYNMSPLRSEMTATEGSMKDILGDGSQLQRREENMADSTRDR